MLCFTRYPDVAMNEVAALVGRLRRESLHRLGALAGKAFQGLAQASRALQLPPRWRRRLRDIDSTVVGLIRHITDQHMVQCAHKLHKLLRRVASYKGHMRHILGVGGEA